MIGKFAFISNENPRDDFIFTLTCENEDEARIIETDLNLNVTNGRIEFIRLSKASRE